MKFEATNGRWSVTRGEANANRIASRHSMAFTLIEILVALAIFCMVLTAIYSTWFTILRGSKVGLEAAASVQRSRIAVRTLEDSLSCIRSFSADMNYYSFIAENGSAASLSFVSRLSPLFPRGGKFGDFDVRRVTFAIEQGADSSKQLVLRQNPVLMDLDVDEKEHPIVLAKNIKKFEMEFWDAKEGEWVDEWTTTNQLPLMVKFTLQFSGKDPQASQKLEEVIRIVSLPSITVQPGWQTPTRQNTPNPNPNNPTPGNPAGGTLTLPTPNKMR